MKQLSLIIVILNSAIFSFSQTMKEEYATKLSSTLNYTEAYPVWAEMAEKSMKKNQSNWTYMRMAVEAATNSEQYDKALFWAEKLTACPDTNSKDWTIYFDLLQINNKQDRLAGAVDSALMKMPSNSSIQKWKKNLPMILAQLSENSEYTIANFRQLKQGEEFCAVTYKNQVVLVSNRRNTGFVNRNYLRTGQYFADLIVIGSQEEIAKDKLWKEIKRTNPHDGPIAFSADYKIAALTVNHTETDQVGKVKYSRLMLKIYRETNGEWKEAEAFPINNKAYSVGHAAFDSKGNLVFASDKPGGFGGVDLYKTMWKDGAWSEPVNLGNLVNTVRDEVFPFISNNGTLYFSSNGWPGNGGLDIFYQEDEKSKAKHIGNPINTNADDFGIYVDEKTGKGMLSSNRNNFKDEVYTISKPVYKIEAEITLTTCDNKPLEKKQVLVKNTKTGLEETLTTDAKGKVNIRPTLNSNYVFSFSGDEQAEAVKSEKTFDKEGKFPISLSAKYKAKSLKLKVVDQDGKAIYGAQLNYYSKGRVFKKYITGDEPVAFSETELAETDSIIGYMINYSDCKFIMPKNELCSADPTVSMNFIKKQESEFIKLENIYYDFDLWNIRPEGKIELDKLVKYMKEHPELPVELGSHTDCRGSDYYNEWLAERRSQSCVNYIKKMGISADKIIAKGYGEKQLVNKCADGVQCSEAEHQMNRRTELKIKLN